VVKYRADILALYGDLFDETYGTLEKQATLMDRLMRLVRSGATQEEALAAATQAFGPRGVAKKIEEEAVARGVAGAQPLVEQQLAQNAARNAAAEAVHVPAAGGAGVAGGEAAAKATEEAAKVPSKWTGAGVAAVGIPAAGIGGYLLGQPNQEQIDAERRRTRNIAFGAGLASGVAAPHIIRGLGSIANSIGGSGSGLYPSLVPGMGY